MLYISFVDLFVCKWTVILTNHTETTLKVFLGSLKLISRIELRKNSIELGSFIIFYIESFYFIRASEQLILDLQFLFFF